MLKLDGQLNALIFPTEDSRSSPGRRMTAFQFIPPWTGRRHPQTPSTSAGAALTWSCWSRGGVFFVLSIWSPAGAVYPDLLPPAGRGPAVVRGLHGLLPARSPWGPALLVAQTSQGLPDEKTA